MEKVLGIVAEYNPFHKGHAYHIKESKRRTGAEICVAVMGGNFLQRGEPALIDKWTRADIAVGNGVDLVLELPFVYACNNAEYFAHGAVRLLDGLGCVDVLSFGSESGDLDALDEIAEVIATGNMEFNALVRDEMSAGVSYPKARQNAVARLTVKSKAAILSKPNNILAVEYLKQLHQLNSSIAAITISRHGPGPDEVDEEHHMAGATALRKLFATGDPEDEARALKCVTPGTRTGIKKYLKKGNRLVFLDHLRALVIFSVLSREPEELADILTATEGLENRLLEGVRKGGSVEEIVGAVKTRRYTETRIKRLLIHTLMGLNKGDMTQIYGGDIYGRILAFSGKGAELLRHIRNNELSSFPLFSNMNRQRKPDRESADLRKLIDFDIKAADLYQLARIGQVKGFMDSKFNPETKDEKGGKKE